MMCCHVCYFAVIYACMCTAGILEIHHVAHLYYTMNKHSNIKIYLMMVAILTMKNATSMNLLTHTIVNNLMYLSALHISLYHMLQLQVASGY